MAIDKAKLNATIQDFKKQYGESGIYTMDSPAAIKQMPRWSTGIENLDAIIGGGIPYGRFVELYGAESAGKTSLAYHLMAQHEMAMDIPIEGTFDIERAKIFGNTDEQLIIRAADYGEQVFETINSFSQTGLPLIVVDSVPFMIPKKQYEENDSEKEARMASIASLMTAKMPKVVNACEKTNTTVILVNQIRDNMNASLFGPKTHTPGGHILQHCFSLRLKVSRYDTIKIPNKDPYNSSPTESIGIIMKVKVEKSKICNPFKECILSLIFDRGFVPNEEVDNIRKEIMKQRNQEFKKLKGNTKDEDV